MAVMNVYTILDRAAEEYGPPFIAKNDEVAKRNFVNLLNEVPAHVKKDYELIRIGNFNTESGNLFTLRNETVVTEEIPE